MKNIIHHACRKYAPRAFMICIKHTQMMSGSNHRFSRMIFIPSYFMNIYVGTHMCSDHSFRNIKKIKKIRFIWRKVTSTISSLEINVRFVDSYPILHKVYKGKYNLSNEATKPQDSFFI